MNRGGRVEATPPECARASEMFDHFCVAATMKQILALHREICNTLNLKPNRLPDFYPKLKTMLASSWKAQALFKKLDTRANHKVYAKGRACSQNKVLIIGAGPCGLRAAIECQLLGAKVVVVEKRDRMTRNNVLHLWPFVIHDLRALGAKKFFGKFCAGSIDHICIRQLQCILLKVSLLLGVEFHEGVSFEQLLEPTASGLGWRANVSPADHPVRQYEFDILVGADGRRNTLQGFNRKEFRGKLALAITANFINRHTEQEASVQEISGVAFIFNQKFFKDLYEKTGIDLENIVYYKDDTHYFVMTAKKHSLLDKGVLLNDYNDISRLLSAENVDRAALIRYAQEAARFSTEGRLPFLDFALNHYGEPDVALFDFTSMYAAENASMVYERLGRRLLCQLVGDSLLEPFWPTGSGCARGFLSALDAAWAVRAWGQTPAPHPLEIIAERESIYRLLAQTTNGNLNHRFSAFTLDPGTRYPNLNRHVVTPHRVTSFYNSDDPLPLDASASVRKRRREPHAEVSDAVLIAWVGITEGGLRAAASPPALLEAVRRYRPDLLPEGTTPRSVYQILHHELGIVPYSSGGTLRDVSDAKLRSYLIRVYNAFKGEVPHIHHQSDVFDQIKLSMKQQKHSRNQSDHPISAYSTAAEADKTHSSSKRKRRSKAQEEGRIVGGGTRASGSGARVAQLAAELSGSTPSAPLNQPKASKPKDLMRSVGKIERDDWNMREIERKILENQLGRPEPKAAERVPKWDREQFLGRQRKLKEGDVNDEKWGEIDETLHKWDQKLRDSGRPDHGTKKVASLATKFVSEPEAPKSQPKEEVKKGGWRGPATAGVQCAACGTRVFAAEGVTADGLQLHRACFKCAVCKAVLRPGNYTMERYGSRLVCLRHSGMSVPDAVASLSAAQRTQPISTPERISLELSDSGAREIDEDEWTDRNFLASETSCAGGLSDEEESSSDEYTDAGENAVRASPVPPDAPPRHHHNEMYFSDDSFGYDDYSDDGAESSGNESCSRMREAREARRREVPADARPSSYSSEVESEESDSSEEVSSATEVSTDSEFAQEESAPPAPPAILVTEAPAPAPPVHTHQPPPAPHEYPLNRTRSAGGLATKRALELKRKYLLGEASPPAVRKSDSSSKIDSKFEAFRSNITEFQKMLTQGATSTQSNTPMVTNTTEKNTSPMPDIIKNLCTVAPVDLLTKVEPSSLLTGYISEKSEPISEKKVKERDDDDLDSDSLSEDDSSHTETAPKNVPRLEVHDEGGELIQLDSLMIINSSTEEPDKASCTGTGTGPTVRAAESESSESGRDATTLALTETELSSDWAAEGPTLDDHRFQDKEQRKRSNNPRSLSGPKLVHDAKNIAAVASHVCGRTSPPQHIAYSNALEHFEYVDEGDQDPSIGTPGTPKNEGYMELVDDEFEYSPGNDRSMNFIERSFSETVVKPTLHEPNVEIVHTIPKEIEETYTDSEIQSPQGMETESSEKSVSDNKQDLYNDSKTSDSKVSDEKTDLSKIRSNGCEPSIESLSITEISPQSKSQPLYTKTTTESETLDDVSPPLVPDTPTKSTSFISSGSLPYSGIGAGSMRLYSPAICRSASDTFTRSTPSTDSHTRSFELSNSVTLSSGSVSPVSPAHYGKYSSHSAAPSRHCDTTDKVQEIRRERDEQTEVVRRLVLERLGSGARATSEKRGRRVRVPPSTLAPPPVPPPPILPPEPPIPPPPPRPAPPLLPMPVTPSFSDPELARERRRKSIMKSISNYLNRHLSPRHKWASEPILTAHEPTSSRTVSNAHKSMGALQEPAPPVPPPPASYSPPVKNRSPPSRLQAGGAGDEERDAMQLWFEARWARLVAQRRAREENCREEPTARRLARLERRLTRPLSAEQQAATVAELVQVSAQREAHQALMKADRRRSAASSGD